MYSVPLNRANEAHVMYEQNKLKEAFNIYVDAIRLFIDVYKKDTNIERKNKIYPVIKNAVEIAEKIKIVLKMPSVQKQSSGIINIANEI